MAREDVEVQLGRILRSAFSAEETVILAWYKEFQAEIIAFDGSTLATERLCQVGNAILADLDEQALRTGKTPPPPGNVPPG